MIFAMNGPKWKALRSIVSPIFSTGKMKAMFPLLDEKADILVTVAEKEMDQAGFIEAKKLMSYYTFDAIATCAFGTHLAG